MKSIATFLIAAPRSNSGKTIITLGLINALKKRGSVVQPFKCGPDYIDSMHHTKIAGRPSYNLDVWMANKQHVQTIFRKNIRGANIAIVEGVMGLFDGAKKDKGSSANIARILNLPVILVVDASSVAYSVAPLLHGFKTFDKRINIAGVIFNKVAGESHYNFLKDAANDAEVLSLGYIPRHEKLAIESRHLGLHLPGENKNMQIVEQATTLIEKYIDIDKLLQISKKDSSKKDISAQQKNNKIKIAMAKDAAFNFSYQANLDALLQLGEIIEFSPLTDNELPDTDLIWLPGGYPELFAKELSENRKMLAAIKSHIEKGKAVIAECGGMMYLGKTLQPENDKAYKMVQIFDLNSSFKLKKLHLGYRELELDGTKLRGHEFHYSNIETSSQKKENNYLVKTARNKKTETPVFRYKNCWASYMHLYLGEPEKLQQLLTHLKLNV
jgi:cobyrinic acid a,c-diamide synthase